MAITIRQASLESDRQVIVDILTRNLPQLPHARRFAWLYLNNPFGNGKAWLAFNDKTEAGVGVASVFPRMTYVCGDTVLGGQVGDFAIDSGSRSLGPAVLLQKATLTPVLEGEMAFCYDTPPDDRGMSTFKRMGITASGRMVRFAKPLRIDDRVEGLLKRGILTSGLSFVGNAVLELQDQLRRHSNKECAVGFEVGRFGQEFTHLNEETKEKYEIFGERTAEYLNWRYKDDPLNQYEIITARENGKLLAYTAVKIGGSVAHIIDIFGQESFMDHLLVFAAGFLREKGIATLQAIVLEGSPLAQIVRKAGFYFRDYSHWLVASGEPNQQIHTLLNEKGRWFVTYSDVVI